jgi:hypothetical protein
MQIVDELKKQIKATDLALASGRKRQSPRTGFVHSFAADETAADTIPLYENFCFALALFRHKTGDSVSEGKELVERLLAFQSEEGNFPIYLHDYPRCWDPLMPLKIASLLMVLIRHFSSVLGEELRRKIDSSHLLLIKAAEKRRLEKPYPPLWENRFLACTGQPTVPIDTTSFSAQEWGEWLLTAQIANEQGPFSIPYHRELEAFVGIPPEQERGEPCPHPIEWVLADAISSPRLLCDHPSQLLCAPFFPIENSPSLLASSTLYAEENVIRLLWGGKSLHSLFAKASRIEKKENQIDLFFDLNGDMKIQREDLFEAMLFFDHSSETQIFIEGKRGTLFRLNEIISVQTPSLSFDLKFELLEGTGDFCGHIFRSNRPTQTACKGALLYEAYDWQIGLRTLRRSADCQIRIALKITTH